VRQKQWPNETQTQTFRTVYYRLTSVSCKKNHLKVGVFFFLCILLSSRNYSYGSDWYFRWAI